MRPAWVVWLVMAAPAALASQGCSLLPSDNGTTATQTAARTALYGGLSDTEALQARKNRQVALEKLVRNRSRHWSGNGGKGETTPIRTYKTVAGVYCREFVEAVETRDAGRRVAVDTACRDRDGQWKLVMN
jgi:surface antigen